MRERDRERDRDRDRDREHHRNREREPERDRNRERARERERDGEREEIQRQRARKREIQGQRSRKREIQGQRPGRTRTGTAQAQPQHKAQVSLSLASAETPPFSLPAAPSSSSPLPIAQPRSRTPQARRWSVQRRSVKIRRRNRSRATETFGRRPGRHGRYYLGEDEDIELMKKLGIPLGFDSTKGKHVSDADVNGVRVVTKRQPLQYMNRRGGFNRSLPVERNK